MVADQEPVSSERKHWLKFLNRDSAFFLGAEEIARTTRYAAFFVRLKRVARGHYEVEFVPLAAAGEQLPAGRIHRALRAHGRRADPRGAGRLALVAQALEAQKAAVRADADSRKTPPIRAASEHS